MAQRMPKCWLIGDPGGRFPRLPAQFARLRNLRVEFLSVPDEVLPYKPPEGRTMLAISFERLQRLSAKSTEALQTWVAAGAVLYVRGGARPGTWAPLGLFGGGEFSIAAHQNATSYHLVRHAQMPAVLADESEQGQFMIPGADDLPAEVEPLVVAEHSDGRQRPAVFAKRFGAGLVLYDLHPEDAASDTPIVARFADPVLRSQNVGALIAADWAAGVDPRTPPPFNLTLDDRPSNLDFFNVANLRNFLDRVDARLPRAHVDFAWTPDQSRPSRRYVDTLKQYRTGFVWHGFLRHVDHRGLEDPARELAEGRRAVEAIARRYDVRFQPVMVFPFELDTPECVEVMRDGGFRAEVRSLAGSLAQSEPMPEYLRFSVPERPGDAHDFVMLYRKSIERLDPDWMLALAALGLPVLAAAHPEDLALRRFARSPWLPDSFEELDRVLEFAAVKSLRPCSLEEIAAELTAD
jgi:hypothetical protein